MVIIYILFCLAVIYLAVYSIKRKSSGLAYVATPSFDEAYFNKNRNFLLLSATVVLIVLCLRGKNVGTDTWNYENHYLLISRMGDYKDFLFYLSEKKFVESGYWGCLFLFSRLDFPVWLTRTVFGVMATVPILLLIYRRSCSVMFGLFVYLCFGYYAFAFTAIRQSVAMGLTVMAYFALEDKQQLKFFIYCLLAITFHMSAIVFIPVCLFGLVKINRLTIFFITSAGIVLYLARNRLLDLYASGYADKGYEATTVGGQRFLLVLIALIVLGWLFRKHFLVNRANQLLFLMSCSAAIVFAVSRANPFFLRAALYFQLYQVCYIPNLVRSIKSARIRVTGYAGFISVGFYYFFTQVCFSYALSPYTFFWQ